MRNARTLRVVALLAIGFSLGAATVRPPNPIMHRAAMTADGEPAEFAARVLRAHNRYRASVGSKPLQWSPMLASAAGAHGPVLGAIGKLVHSAREGRPGQAESLWLGTRGAYTVEAMIDYWGDERSMMKSGVFPNVSTTGNWLDVSHYTQMIWPETTHVGCHLQRGRAHDILICRYTPKGNRDGRVMRR